MRLMFVRGSVPLAHLRVRVHANAAPIVADEEGGVQLDLPAGRHDVQVELDGTWLPVALEVGAGQTLLVVDADAALAPTQKGFAPAGATGQLAKLVQGELGAQLADLGGRYQIERVLGRGGMGVVLRAQDRLLQRTVAIKTLNEELAGNADAQQIFLTEARGLAALSHPNLVSIHDVTQIEGRAIIVFEFIEGKSLEALLAEQGRLDEADLLRAGIQMGRAFDYLHKKGFIHRDIKPANMLVQADGTLKVIDFGLARSLDDIVNKGTQIRGTPAYMAPEQLLGEPLTGATDVYQLGITLYELASGKLPFEGGHIMFAHVHTAPTPLLHHVPTLSPELASLIMQCIAKSPAERPSAERLTSDLRTIYLSNQQAYDQQGLFALSMGGATAEFELSQLTGRPRTAPAPASVPVPALLAPPARVAVTTGAQHDPVQTNRGATKLVAGLILAILCALSAIALILGQGGAPDAAQRPTSELPTIAAQVPADEAIDKSVVEPSVKLSPSEEIKAVPSDAMPLPAKQSAQASVEAPAKARVGVPVKESIKKRAPPKSGRSDRAAEKPAEQPVAAPKEHVKVAEPAKLAEQPVDAKNLTATAKPAESAKPAEPVKPAEEKKVKVKPNVAPRVF